MPGDPNVQAGGSVAGKPGNKNKKSKKQTQGGDASTSRDPPVIEALVEGVEQIAIRAGPGQSATAAPKKPAPKKEPKPGSPVTDLKVAFDKEDAEDAEESKKPKRVAKASAEAAFADLEKYTGIKLNQTDQSALCLRPKFASGRGGETTKVLTNFFRLKIQGNVVYQYDVKFLKSDESAAVKKEQEVGRKFKRLTKKMNQSLLQAFVSTTGKGVFSNLSYAYDNDRILITSKALPEISTPDGKIFTFQMSEVENEAPRVQTIYIRIKPTVRLPLVFEKNVDSNRNIVHNRAVLQVLDIIAKAYAFQNDIIYGSKIFLSPQKSKRIPMAVGRDNNIPTPYELAFGYHQSTQFCEAGPMQNIDRATAVLYKGGPLIRTIESLLAQRFDYNSMIGPRDLETLKELTYLRFETDYRGFTSRHTLRSFTKSPCNETYFKNEHNQNVSVADYFNNHYKLTLKFPCLPCVEYSPGRFIPIEMCTLLPDQRNQRKLRDELIRIVSQHTTSQKPYERSKGTVDVAHNIARQLSNNGFEIELIPSPVTVNSRILASPSLKYGNKASYFPTDPGSWDMRDNKFLKPITLTRWACFSLDSRKIDGQVAGAFVGALRRQGTALGINISNPSVPFKQFGPQRLEETFKECAKSNLQLIIVMMPENTDLYSLVKSVGDQRLGVPTQVVLDKHYNPRGPRQKLMDIAYLSNLLLKINMKIGGTNLKLSDNSVKSSILNDKTMVVGVDVNHPSPGENSPSIAAVVGSLDADFSQYRTEIRVNSSRDEIVQVDQMIVPILKAFKAARDFYPEHIIVYRDGVSEGQFAAVMGSEILPLHKKLETLPSRPKLTYMIVQKRHNARFFPTDRNKATRNGNILPGSVIDTDICHYKWFDFYLCSQNSFLGTARPGKYTVLWHSSSANANDLQMATYYLCYLFARATKSIADPAPARYAHHAAARGKVHLKQILLNRGQRGQNRDVNQELNRAVNVTTNLQQILYFI